MGGRVWVTSACWRHFLATAVVLCKEIPGNVLNLCLPSHPQELEAALHRDDVEFISDLIACLLQGCYQRRDIT